MVPDQHGVSRLYDMFEIHHSSSGPSNFETVSGFSASRLAMLDQFFCVRCDGCVD